MHSCVGGIKAMRMVTRMRVSVLIATIGFLLIVTAYKTIGSVVILLFSIWFMITWEINLSLKCPYCSNPIALWRRTLRQIVATIILGKALECIVCFKKVK